MAKKQPDFEKQMERLQEIVELLEDMDVPLSTNVALYKEGKSLASSCIQLLEQARHEVQLCDGEETTEFPTEKTATESLPLENNSSDK